jgi:hypothetical protein
MIYGAKFIPIESPMQVPLEHVNTTAIMFILNKNIFRQRYILVQLVGLENGPRGYAHNMSNI